MPRLAGSPQAPIATGDNSPRESVATGTPISRAKPRPRLTPEAQHPTTASARFLARFGARTSLAAPDTLSRAMNNTGSAHGTAKSHVTADAPALAPADPAAAQAPTEHTGGGQQ